jgi:predicted O-methyltransferase YrrM
MTLRDLPSRVGMAVWRRRHPDWAQQLDEQTVPMELQLPFSALPRYAAARARVALSNRIKGTTGRPWIAEDATILLESLIRPDDRIVEFGAGGSTEWFARLAREVYSVDGFDDWYNRLRERLTEQNITNVTLELASAAELGYQSDAHRDAYVNFQPTLEEGSADLVFIDGEYRDDCALRGLGLLRSGGLLVVDNVNIYLPSPSRSPWHVSEPTTEKWREFLKTVSDWRRVWTTNGIWDTAIWFKP